MDEGGGPGVDEFAHPVGPVGDGDRTVGARISVSFGDGAGLEAFGESLNGRAQARRREILGSCHGLDGKSEAGLGVQDRGTRVDDHARVAHEDPPLFERLEHRAEPVSEHPGVVDLPLNRPVGGADREREFCCDRAEVHLTLPRIGTQHRRTGCRELARFRKQPNLGRVHLCGLLAQCHDSLDQTEEGDVVERPHVHGLIRSHVRYSTDDLRHCEGGG